MHDYSGTERAYYASLKFALEDGMIDHKEFSHLSELREQFEISQELHHQMELEIREEIADVDVEPGGGKPLIDVGDSVVSKSTITAIGRDYIDDRDTIVQYGKGDIENYAKMTVNAVQMGKLEDAVKFFNKAKEINFEEAKEVFEKKYGKEISAAYTIAALPLLLNCQTEWGKGMYQSIYGIHLGRFTICIGNALAFDSDNVQANIMQGQGRIAFMERSEPAHKDVVKNEAIEAFQKALSIEPNNQEAQDGLRKAQGLSTSTSACFIATAAYGMPFAKEIDVLRNWRDDFLAGSIFGRIFINTYYQLSPPIAENIGQSRRKRQLVRTTLNPLVKILKSRYSK